MNAGSLRASKGRLAAKEAQGPHQERVFPRKRGKKRMNGCPRMLGGEMKSPLRSPFEGQIRFGDDRGWMPESGRALSLLFFICCKSSSSVNMLINVSVNIVYLVL